MNGLLQQLHAQRSTFTPAQERIAAYLLAETLEAALLTGTDLAQRLDVDPATVVRFAQKLGYRGYIELRADLNQWVRNRENPGSTPVGSLGRSLNDARTSLNADFNKLWQSLDNSDLVRLAEWIGTPCRLLLLSDDECSTVSAWLHGELLTAGFAVDSPARDPEKLAASLLALDGFDRILILEGTVPSPALAHLRSQLGRVGTPALAIVGSNLSQPGQMAEMRLQLSCEPRRYAACLQLLMMTCLTAIRDYQLALQRSGSVLNPSIEDASPADGS